MTTFFAILLVLILINLILLVVSVESPMDAAKKND